MTSPVAFLRLFLPDSGILSSLICAYLILWSIQSSSVIYLSIVKKFRFLPIIHFEAGKAECSKVTCFRVWLLRQENPWMLFRSGNAGNSVFRGKRLGGGVPVWMIMGRFGRLSTDGALEKEGWIHLHTIWNVPWVRWMHPALLVFAG